MPNQFVFDGRLASPPDLRNSGEKAVCKLTLIRNEYAGENREQRKVAIYFTAFRKTAEAIANNAREGDQLIITARIENNDYTPDNGETKYGHSFIVEDFDFGAPGKQKRDELAARNAA